MECIVLVCCVGVSSCVYYDIVVGCMCALLASSWMSVCVCLCVCM